ncbi:MAG TPA: DUF1353 domain-containing protein [Casimicrobiaceae bacterium]|nr:DUF1353 domain-containing protein [Casimicrobiaceae bacterium]
MNGWRRAWAVAITFAIVVAAPPARPQQIIEPVDFRPFADGKNWIVRQSLVYTIGVSSDRVVVPVGFVTDFASIPPALQSIIQAHGPYILPAVVHDYLYWTQACTRAQADRILLLGMIENGVREFHRTAIHNAVAVAGGFAWDDNARERASGLIRILPADRQQVPGGVSWPEYRLRLKAEEVAEGPDTPVAPASCARADLSIEDALTRP